MPSQDKAFVVKNGFVVNTNLIYAANGQVGVGTVSPDATLTVNGTANVRGNMTVNGNLIVNGTINFDTSVLNTFRLTTGNTTVNVVVSNTDIRIGNTSVNSVFTSTTIQAGVFSVNTTKSQFTGNVGILTANITSPLTVNGQIELQAGGIKYPDGSVQTTAPSAAVLSGGSNTQIQYSTGSGSFGASANLTFDVATTIFTVNGTSISKVKLAGDGSAANPSIAFSANTDTGFLRSGVAEISMSLGGTVRWQYKTTGSTLTGTLLVNGNTAVNGQFTTTQNSTFNANVTVNASSQFIGNTTFSANMYANNNVVDSPIFKNWKEGAQYIGNANGTVNLDLSNTNVFRVDMVSNVTFTVSNPPANNIWESWTLHIKHVNASNTTWPVNFKNPGALAQPETATSGGYDIWQFGTIDGGTTYALSLAMKDIR